MSPLRSTGRRASAPAAVALAAIAALLGSAGAASAATAKPVFTLDRPTPVALAASPASTEADFQLHAPSAKASLSSMTLTVDARGLSKIAKVRFSGSCKVKGLVATCKETDLDEGFGPAPASGPGLDDTDLNTALHLTLLKGVKLGATAHYTISGTAKNATVKSATGTVTAGGAQLVPAALPKHSGLTVGGTVSEPLQFTNKGNRPTAGVEFVAISTPALSFAPRHSDCSYGSLTVLKQNFGNVALCTVPGRINPGGTASVSTPLTLKSSKAALSETASVFVVPSGLSLADILGLEVKLTKGTGSALKLHTVKAGTKTSAPVSTVPLDPTASRPNETDVTLNYRNTADFAVTSTSETGAVNSTPTFTVTVTNNGPGTLEPGYDDATTPSLVVTLPPGTSIVNPPAECWQQSTAHPDTYVCEDLDNLSYPTGAKFSVDFTVRVKQVIPGAKGSARLGWGDNSSSKAPWFDPNTANNSTPLDLN